MRKAQFEIMGLAIIVIIISIAIFFLLSFSMKPEPDLTGQFQKEQFLQNAVTAWLDADIQGCEQDIKGYVAHYATGLLTEDGPRCDSPELMDELVDELQRMLDNYPVITSYHLSIRYGVCMPIANIDGTNCREKYSRGNCDPAKRDTRPGREVLPLMPIPGNAEVVLFSCAIA